MAKKYQEGIRDKSEGYGIKGKTEEEFDTEDQVLSFILLTIKLFTK